MGNFKEGDLAWWLTPSNTPHFIAVAIQQVLVLKQESPDVYMVKNVQNQFVTLLSSQMYLSKKDALNACVRQLQEIMYNE